jgi:hypothetical protein
MNGALDKQEKKQRELEGRVMTSEEAYQDDSEK